MMTFAAWQGKTGKVVQNQIGRVLVDFGDERRWLLKGIPGLTIFEKNERGRPRAHGDNASRQRAYRERKAGKALRKYQRKGATE